MRRADAPRVRPRCRRSAGRGQRAARAYARAVQVVEAFYRVRFGRQVLDAAAAQTVEQALEELTAGPPPTGIASEHAFT